MHRNHRMKAAASTFDDRSSQSRILSVSFFLFFARLLFSDSARLKDSIDIFFSIVRAVFASLHVFLVCCSLRSHHLVSLRPKLSIWCSSATESPSRIAKFCVLFCYVPICLAAFLICNLQQFLVVKKTIVSHSIC